MQVAVFHGAPRRGNTYFATKIFMDELAQCGDVSFMEFFMPHDLPKFCAGCAQCIAGKRQNCPSAEYADVILQAILTSDAMIFATPHYGASAMPASMKNLFDHLDFLVMPISPRREIFEKKAFVILTGSGSSGAAKQVKAVLKKWGVNRVYTYSVRLLTDKWSKMPTKKQQRHDLAIKEFARAFYKARKKRAHISTIGFYYVSEMIIKKYVGAGNYPYKYWKESGYFDKRPF